MSHASPGKLIERTRNHEAGGACEPVAGGSYTYASTVVKRATSTTPVAAL